ncbi:putative RNA polymerase ECF subfamily sigma factor [Ilumatobacter coccineus YM16-304]|uniref:Putative RNA polymerase ECF subfamily sigma factor n=1 Tax=Ilumatobacter coccineus (strain NBRC 103263 / KCTC 29153 / YM16-304) TaxID=1313172 RepID=A0A6C7E314_ILUCY|nr:putative RNA polymerase ECF subfamily sigma factor [Ilumatobacter coccineus YM16-304]
MIVAESELPAPSSASSSSSAAPATSADASAFDTVALTFDGFFADHYERIARALAVSLGDDHLGRDAASEGFAKALQRWNRVQQYANPAGWIYRVGLNWARSRRRKSRREVARPASVLDGAVTEFGDHEPGLAPALARLSVDHRAVVVARYYLDWSEAQIATALDIKPGTVKSRLSRAIDELATSLGSDSHR